MPAIHGGMTKTAFGQASRSVVKSLLVFGLDLRGDAS
jgi:hypothetical protein